MLSFFAKTKFCIEIQLVAYFPDNNPPPLQFFIICKIKMYDSMQQNEQS